MDTNMLAAWLLLCAMMLAGQCQGRHRAPPVGMAMPARRKLMTWRTYVNPVAGRTWTMMYLWTPNNNFAGVTRWEPSPMLQGDNMVVMPDNIRMNGVCTTSADFTYPTAFEHAPREKMAIMNAGSQQDRYFSRRPDSYYIMARCFGRVVKGRCVDDFTAVTLMVRHFPPDQLDWWSVIRDLKYAMGLSFEDPRFAFTGIGLGCPE